MEFKRIKSVDKVECDYSPEYSFFFEFIDQDKFYLFTPVTSDNDWNVDLIELNKEAFEQAKIECPDCPRIYVADFKDMLNTIFEIKDQATNNLTLLKDKLELNDKVPIYLYDDSKLEEI